MHFSTYYFYFLEENRLYSPRKLEEALAKVKDKTLTTWEASKMYNIPRTTLTYKACGIRPEKSSRPGPKPMLGTIFH